MGLKYDNRLYSDVRPPPKGGSLLTRIKCCLCGMIVLTVDAGDHVKNIITDKFVRNAILDRIKNEGIEAMKRYGREIGECAICGRALTDEVSRKIGIGPICMSRLE